MILCDRCEKKLDKARWPVAYGRGKSADLCQECYDGLLEYLGQKTEDENESEKSR